MANEHQHKNLSDDPVVRGHETSDIDPKSVAISGIALSVGIMMAGILFSWGVYSFLKSHSNDPGKPVNVFVKSDSTSLPPLPRLQIGPHVTLVQFEKNQDSILSSYAWVSKDSGIVRIPIERAMKLVVERGLPVQSK